MSSTKSQIVEVERDKDSRLHSVREAIVISSLPGALRTKSAPTRIATLGLVLG